MKKAKIMIVASLIVVVFLASYLVFFSGKSVPYYNNNLKIGFQRNSEYEVTQTASALSGKLDENVTFAVFVNDVYDLVSKNIRDAVNRSEMDFNSGIFNAGFTNPIYLATFVKNLFDDEDYEFYQFEKVDVSDSLPAYRCYFNSKSTLINGRCYFTVDDARFYIFVFYISKDTASQKKEEKIIDKFMNSVVIYPYDYEKGNEK